jgi:LysR family tcuABC transcriptional regulator
VSVGLTPTTAAVLGMPLMAAMRERYPDVRLHMVESLSGHLGSMLNARQLDMAVLFDARSASADHLQSARRWGTLALLDDALFLIRTRVAGDARVPKSVRLADLRDVPLILPTGPHGLRSTLDAAFERAGLTPRVVLEVDSLSMLMEAVAGSLGATLQPWAAVGRISDAAQRFYLARIADKAVKRRNLLCTLSDDELSPAALATRVVLIACVRELVAQGQWVGATLL